MLLFSIFFIIVFVGVLVYFYSVKQSEKNDNNFCLLPFVELRCFADGRYTPCCKYEGMLTHKGKELNAVSASPKVAWNSDSLKKLRKQFLKNEKPQGCIGCWQPESFGVQSMRQEVFRYDYFLHKRKKELLKKYQHSVAPIRLQLDMSNKCNLKCRICCDQLSSQWSKERHGTNTYTNFHTEETLRVVQSWLPYLMELRFLGGEPLLLNENIQLIKNISESPFSKNLAVHIATNGTIFSEELCHSLPRFNNASLSFSLDDIGPRFEYQRKGARYNEVINNMLQYQAFFSEMKQIRLLICITVSLLNVYYLPELLEVIYANFPRYFVQFNMLTAPEELSIWNIPETVKDKVKARLQCIALPLKIPHAVEGIGIMEIIRFMYGQEMKAGAIPFITTIKDRDIVRNELYEAVFPEFWKFVNE